jgi:hypothetical protein
MIFKQIIILTHHEDTYACAYSVPFGLNHSEFLFERGKRAESIVGTANHLSIYAASSSGVPFGKASFRKSRNAETRALSNRRDG